MGAKYTGVIFFHGVGDPQRHVSLGSFLDQFDLFGQQHINSGIGSAQRFRYRGTVDERGQFIPYVELKNVRKSPNGKTYPFKSVRLFEAYWVPESSVRYSTLYVVGWLLVRIMNPVKLLLSRWRSFPAVRLWSLIYLSQREDNEDAFKRLERLYKDFDGWDSRRECPKGSYFQFRSLIEEKANASEKDRLLSLLRKWQGTFVRYNIKLLTKCVYYSFLFVALLVLLSVSSWEAYRAIANEGSVGPLSAPALIATASFILLALGWIKLKRYALDVLTWTLESEKDERIKARDRVVTFARRMIRTVVDDPNCADCVLVGHSLGSCIAIEALLREGQVVKAMAADAALTSVSDNILKVRDVFTVASPIDRIFYFFQSDRAFSHRYNRVFEEQRLTVNLPPFWNVGEAGRARITNLWSKYDPISSELNSVRKSVAERADAVSNYECLPPGVPLPVGTHISYFEDQAVMGRIYTSVMGGGEVSQVSLKHPKRLSATISLATYVLPILTLMSLAMPLAGLDARLPLLGGVALWLLGAWGAAEIRYHHQLHVGRYLKR